MATFIQLTRPDELPRHRRPRLLRLLRGTLTRESQKRVLTYAIVARATAATPALTPAHARMPPRLHNRTAQHVKGRHLLCALRPQGRRTTDNVPHNR